MLSRIYIDNFRCFVDFEYRPARKQLILGANGTGKTSFLEALLTLRRFAYGGHRTSETFPASKRTRWIEKPEQRFEVDVVLDGANYRYELQLHHENHPEGARVVRESIQFETRPIFEFADGEVALYSDSSEPTTTYPFNPRRSAFAETVPQPDNKRLLRFRDWIGGVYCFQLNPFEMAAEAEKEFPAPAGDFRNFAAWYRHLRQTFQKQDYAFLGDLQSALDGFISLHLEPVGESVRKLTAEFDVAGGHAVRYSLTELSEGQRCLISLYAILHFIVAKGGTVVIDEPDNFVSLREIQPWLMAVTDAVDDGLGQVLLISHHPEIIDQWAPEFGVFFTRQGSGAARVEKFKSEPDSPLAASELIARGWAHE